MNLETASYIASFSGFIMASIALVKLHYLKPDLDFTVNDATHSLNANTGTVPSQTKDYIHFEIEGIMENPRLSGTMLSDVELELNTKQNTIFEHRDVREQSAELIEDMRTFFEEIEPISLSFSFSKNEDSENYPLEVSSFFKSRFFLEGEIETNLAPWMQDELTGQLIFKSIPEKSKEITIARANN